MMDAALNLIHVVRGGDVRYEADPTDVSDLPELKAGVKVESILCRSKGNAKADAQFKAEVVEYNTDYKVVRLTMSASASERLTPGKHRLQLRFTSESERRLTRIFLVEVWDNLFEANGR